jgi:hypothetical protein
LRGFFVGGRDEPPTGPRVPSATGKRRWDPTAHVQCKSVLKDDHLVLGAPWVQLERTSANLTTPRKNAHQFFTQPSMPCALSFQSFRRLEIDGGVRAHHGLSQLGLTSTREDPKPSELSISQQQCKATRTTQISRVRRAGPRSPKKWVSPCGAWSSPFFKCTRSYQR